MKTAKLPSPQQYTDEATLLRKIVEFVEPQRRSGVKLLKIRDRYARGYSDLFLCVHGMFVVAELKDDIGKPSVEQENFIQDIQQCGGIGAVCRSVKDVQDLIDEAKRRAPTWTNAKS